MRYSDSYSAVPFRQDIVPVRDLIKKGVLHRDAIVINGNSGDFTSGGHIPNIFFEDQPLVDFNIDTIVTETIKKHFSLWINQSQPNSSELIKSQLIEELQEEMVDCKSENSFASMSF